MPDRTAYDPLLFTGTAGYYRRFRAGYPALMFDFLSRTFDLDERARVLDLGCGTGLLAVPLAASGAYIVAMDPDPEMLAEAAIAANEAGVGKIEFVQGSSWDLADHLGRFRLVTIGRAFHWMDREATLAAIESLVEPGGGVALIAEEHRHYPLADSYGVAQKAIEEVRESILGPVRLAGSATYGHPLDRHEVVLAASAFGDVAFHLFPCPRTWTVGRLIGLALSSSGSSPRLLGDRRAEFEARVRQRLLALNPEGLFEERATAEAVIGRRPNH